MTHAEPFWLQAPDVKLYGQEWDHISSTRGVICLVHGYAEHIGRYEHVADYFARHGFTVFGYDLRGHGQSGGTRAHVDSFEQYINDLDLVLAQARQRHPGLPMFLYGHSLGGSQVLTYAIRRKPQIQGLISTAPLLRLAEIPKAKAMLARVLSNIIPSLGIPYVVDINGLSRDPSISEKYINDPLVLRVVSVRLGMELLKAGAWLLEHADELTLPTLMIQGGADYIVAPDAAREFTAKAPESLLTYKEWEGGYHELHNDIIKEEVLNFILAWIEARLA